MRGEVKLTAIFFSAPELLFGATEYTTAVDMWSIGCIFGELILKEPLLPGKGEIDQVAKVNALRPVVSFIYSLFSPRTDLQTPRSTDGGCLAWFLEVA